VNWHNPDQPASQTQESHKLRNQGSLAVLTAKVVCLEMKELVSGLPKSCTDQTNKHADVKKQIVATMILDVVKRKLNYGHD